jgi:hypothetical protein
MAGYSNSNDGDVTGNHGYFDSWLIKLNAQGNSVWQKSIGGTGEERAIAITELTDDAVSVAGFSYSNDGDMSGNHGGVNYWITKLK